MGLALRLLICVVLAAGCNEPGTAEEYSDPLDLTEEVASDAADLLDQDGRTQVDLRNDNTDLQTTDLSNDRDEGEELFVDGLDGDTPGDATPPEISIIQPEPWAIVTSHDLTVSGTASDDVGVDKVELTVDGDPVIADGRESWTVELAGLDDGEHMLQATAWDEAGNSTSTEIQVGINTCPPGVDLAVTRAHLRQDTVKQYGGFFIDFEVENLGFDDLIWLLHTQVYLSEDDVLDLDTDIRVGVLGNLAEHWPWPYLNEVRGCSESGDRELFVGFFQPIPHGDYRVFLQLPFTSDYSLPDVDMTNNTVLLPESLTVLDEVAAPDLQLKVKSTPDVFFTRGSVPIELRLSNQGDLAGSDHSVEIWLDRIGDNNDVRDPEDYSQGSLRMRKGNHDPYSFRIEIPDSRDSRWTPDLRGEWHLVLYAKSGNNTLDRDPSDNWYKKRVKVERGETIVRVSLQTTADTAKASEPLPITLSVENQSGFPSRQLYSDLTLYTVGSDGEPDEPAIELAEENPLIDGACDTSVLVPGLDPLDSYVRQELKLTPFYPFRCQLGVPYIPVLRYSVPTEVDRTQVASQPLELNSEIDLVVENVFLDDLTISKASDERADFVVQVANHGTATNRGDICSRISFEVRLQLGLEPAPEDDPRAGRGSVPADSIAPGRSVKGRGYLFATDLAPVGTWPAYIVLDPYACESNYANNISPLPSPVTIVP